jgi:hypothetical protein
LEELYKNALKALSSDHLEEALNFLEQANPILEKMQERDRMRRKAGIPSPRSLSDRTLEIMALHNKLQVTCNEEHRHTEEACGKLAKSRKFLQGYKPHKKNLGQLLDGEG